MDLNALIAPVTEFFSTTIGQIVAEVLKVIYAILYPSNADAARIEGA